MKIQQKTLQLQTELGNNCSQVQTKTGRMEIVIQIRLAGGHKLAKNTAADQRMSQRGFPCRSLGIG